MYEAILIGSLVVTVILTLVVGFRLGCAMADAAMDRESQRRLGR